MFIVNISKIITGECCTKILQIKKNLTHLNSQKIINFFVYLSFFRIQIGFCDKEFPLSGTYVGNQISSIAICHKGGMRVNCEFKQQFGRVNGDFGCGMVGIGLIHSPVDSALKAFASYDGEYLGKYSNFYSLMLPNQFI